MIQFAIGNDTTDPDKFIAEVGKEQNITNNFDYKIDAMATMDFLLHREDCKDLFRKAQLIKGSKVVGSNEELNKDIDDTLCYKYARKNENFLLMKEILKGRKLDKKIFAIGWASSSTRTTAKAIMHQIKKEAEKTAKPKVNAIEIAPNTFTVHLKFNSENDFVIWKLKNNLVTDLKVSDKEKTKTLVEENF